MLIVRKASRCETELVTVIIIEDDVSVIFWTFEKHNPNINC